MRSVIQYILKILAKLALKRHRPKIVGVTGSNGKSSAKEAIACVLSGYFKVRASYRNFNNEVGVPLTILGVPPGGNSVLAWLRSLTKAITVVLGSGKNYPEILILEMAVDKPGDMKYLTGFIKPDAAVITAIGEFPVHMEFFPEKDALMKEKGLLSQALKENGTAILNYDDLSVRMIGDELPKGTKTIYYGFGGGADLKMANYELHLDDLESGKFGLSFKVEHDGSVVPVRLNRVLSRQQTYAAVSAMAVGLHFGLNLVKMSGALANYRVLPGRTNLIKGIKNTWIIDDSYNASPLSTMAALELLSDIANERNRGDSGESGDRTSRKIAVLGNMAELGRAAEDGHRQVGKRAAEVCDLLFAVGDKAKLFMADEARKNGMNRENIFEFETTEETQIPLQDEIKEGDIILIKASHSMHFEKLTQEIMAQPERAGELLVS